jgi:hypothetical protein
VGAWRLNAWRPGMDHGMYLAKHRNQTPESIEGSSIIHLYMDRKFLRSSVRISVYICLWNWEFSISAPHNTKRTTARNGRFWAEREDRSDARERWEPSHQHQVWTLKKTPLNISYDLRSVNNYKRVCREADRSCPSDGEWKWDTR